MRGIFKRLGAMFAPSGESVEAGEEMTGERIQPAGAIDGRFPIQPAPPVSGAVKFLHGTEQTVDEYEQTFRRGLIGPWHNWEPEDNIRGELVVFHADHTGTTVVVPKSGPRERCIFEWQPMGDRCIRVRYIVWLLDDDENAPDDESEDEQSDGDPSKQEFDEPEAEDNSSLDEPEPGEWEVIEYTFSLGEGDDGDEIILVRNGEEGFPCACRAGQGPLIIDLKVLKQARDRNLLRATGVEDEETLLHTPTIDRDQSPETLVQPEPHPK